MKTITFTIHSDNNLPEINGVIINDKKNKKAKVTFFSDLLKEKNLDDCIIENPAGFLYTHLTNKTDLFEKGYTEISFEDGSKQSLKPNNKLDTATFLVSPTGILLSKERSDELEKLLGKETFEKTVRQIVMPVDSRYTKDKRINNVLAKNLVSIEDPNYLKNKKEIHRLITLSLNGTLDEKYIGLILNRHVSKASLFTKVQYSHFSKKTQNVILFYR